MRINMITQSSLAKYSVKKGGNNVNSTLEEQLIKSMEFVWDELRKYVGYDILLDNCNSLTVSERYAKNLEYQEIFIYWVDQHIHCYFTMLMTVLWIVILKWIGL